ncbi:MAG: hypothetical protein M1823_004752 [Watsoniomyces obsoletus]|nr:MAG: hypothetical protein M1823_004752 [Watsoniomyces obsoletus]
MRPAGPRPTVAGPPTGPEPPFPLRVGGPVISGFGRGSKELGIPTANIPIDGLSIGGYEEVESGVYFGWAGLEQHSNVIPGHHDGEANGSTDGVVKGQKEFRVYPMVMSIGWNPFYKNEKRSIEVHILHTFEHDFYGAQLNLLILGFIRPEYDYVSREALIEDIRIDIAVTERSLEREAYKKLADDAYLKMNPKGQPDQRMKEDIS